MTSLYAEYLRERTADFIIEKEGGFATFRFLNETQVYLVDIYVRPAFRANGYASRLADQIAEIAKARGCTEMLGTVQASAKNSTASIDVLRGYGMTLKSASADCVVFRKDL